MYMGLLLGSNNIRGKGTGSGKDRSLKQISRGQPRNKGHSKQAIFWWLKN